MTSFPLSNYYFVKLWNTRSEAESSRCSACSILSSNWLFWIDNEELSSCDLNVNSSSRVSSSSS